jgi:hypothetical protein
MARLAVTGRRTEATTAAEVEIAPKKKKKKLAPVVLVPNAAAYTIPEFCEAHRISESMYYKIRADGLGPREARAFTKVIITKEAAADWRRARETPTTTEAA